MPFRVVMPDGTVVDNVPDGTTREEFDSRAARNGYGRATTSFSAQTITPVDDPSPFQSPAPIVPRGTSQSPPRPAAMLEQRVVDDLAELRQPGINRSPISHRVQTLSKFYGDLAPAYEGLIDLLYDDYPKHHALIDKHIKAGLDPVRIRAIVRAQDEEDRKAEAARQKHEFERNLAGITDPVQQKAVADMTGSIEQLRSEIGRTDTPEAVGLMDLGLGGAARQAAAEGQMRNIMRKRTDASMLPDNTTTATGAFTAEMLSKAAPMASGFAAAPAGAEAGLVGGPILSLVGGLGAFYVAYATADYAQRKAFELAAGPELTAQVKQYADTYRQEHPAATALGSEAPYLAMMKPNPTHFREVLGAAKAVRTGTAFTPAQKTAMLTVGSGIGIMGGMEGISQIREGDLNVPRLATSIGLGAVLHEPRLGGPVTGQRPRPDLPTELNPQSPAYVAAQKALERETAMAAGAPYRRAGMTLPDLATPLADRPGPTRADIPAAIEPARQGLSPADYLANITAERTRVSDQATAEIANALESRKSYKSRREYLTGRAKAAGVNIDGYNNAEAIPKIVEGEARNAALRPVRMPAERQTIPLDKVLASRAERERIARVLKIRNPHNLPDADLESALVEALTNPKTLKSLSELDRASVFGSEEIAPVANQHAERVQMLDPNAALEPAVGAEPLPVRQKAYIEPDASAGRALTYRPTLKQSLEDTRGLPRLPDEPSPLSPAPEHPPDAASGTTAGEPLPPPKPPEPTSPPPAKAAPAKPPVAAENPLFSARPQNLAAETAARGQRGAVRVGGLAEVAQRVQNKFRGLLQREKLKDAMTEFDYHRAAGEQMVKRHGATLQALRAELTKAGYPDKQVFDDLVATFTTEPSGSMTADQFIAKYNLDPAMQASVREMIQTAKNMANALGPRLKQAGMEGRGGLVAANELYSTVAYMKHQTRGAYEPTPSAVAAAESHIESVFSKAIDGIAKRATSFKRRGANNIIAFLNEPNRALARAHLSGLTPAQMDAAHALKSRYENSKSMIGMLVDNGQSIVAMKNQQAMSDAAKQFVHEIQQPRKAPMEMTSGMGSAIDNLTRRELEPVFRELFGEIKDPAFVYPASREIQGELIDRLALMHRASEVAGIHSEQRNSEMGHTVRLTSSQDLYGPVTAADRSKYGVLAGKWVAPQVKEFLGGRERGSRLRQAEDVLNKIAGIQRGGALLRIARPIRDKVSNLFSFASGARDTAFPVIFTKYYAKAESMLWKYVKARAANDQRGIAEARAFFEDLSKKGIFRATSSSVFEDLERAMTGIPGGKTLQNLQKLSAYWADLPTKYAGYMTRMEKAAAWGIANPEIEALRHLQRGYDNRDAIPIVVRGFAKKWYAPDFLTFKASSLRSMALNAVDMVADMANPKIPALDKLRMLAAWSQSMTTQALLTTTKAGIWATKRAAQATLLYKASGLLSKDGKVVEPEVSDALRYMAPTFAQQDAVDVFSDTDNKGNPVLIKATVGSGSWSAYPLLDVLYGAMQSADVEGLQNTPGQSLLRQFVGTGGNIPINNLVQLFSGENLGDPDYRVGLTKGVAEAIKALFNNDLDHDEKMKRAKFYGWEATKRIMEYGGKALGSAVDVPARASRQEAIKESASTRWSRKVEGGDRLPIGIYPVTDYIPTRDAKDVLAQSVSPMNVQVFSHEDLRYNMLLKAEYMKRTLFPADEPSQREENRTMSEPERMSREDAQLERMRPWVQYSTTLLKSIGDDPQPRLIDMLKKAGFAERQITNLLELPEGSLQDRGARLPKLFKPATLQRLRSSL